jgi:hypothetical protein
MGQFVREEGPCSALFVTDGPFLDDAPEPAGLRALFRALPARNVHCRVVCRFLVPGELETDPRAWL